MSSGMLPLGRLITEGLRRFHLENGVKAKQSVSLWERVAGPTVAAVTHADGIRDGILYVHTRSSSWSQELALLREPLIARINAELEQEAVKEIRFQVKRFAPAEGAPVEEAAPPRDLTPDERQALDALSASLDDVLAARLTSVAEKQMLRAEPGRACPGCGGPVRPGETRCPFCR